MSRMPPPATGGIGMFLPVRLIFKCVFERPNIPCRYCAETKVEQACFKVRGIPEPSRPLPTPIDACIDAEDVLMLQYIYAETEIYENASISLIRTLASFGAYNKAIPNLPLRNAMLLFAASCLPITQPRPRMARYFLEAYKVLWQNDINSSEDAITLFILSWVTLYCSDDPSLPDQPLFRLQASGQFHRSLTAIETRANPEMELVFSKLSAMTPSIPEGLPLGNAKVLDRFEYILRSLYKRTSWFDFERVKSDYRELFKNSPHQNQWERVLAFDYLQRIAETLGLALHVYVAEQGGSISKSHERDRMQFLNYIEDCLTRVRPFVKRESERCAPCSCDRGNCFGNAMVAIWTYSLLVVALTRGPDVVSRLHSEVCCQLGFALVQHVMTPCFWISGDMTPTSARDNLSHFHIRILSLLSLMWGEGDSQGESIGIVSFGNVKSHNVIVIVDEDEPITLVFKLGRTTDTESAPQTILSNDCKSLNSELGLMCCRYST